MLQLRRRAPAILCVLLIGCFVLIPTASADGTTDSVQSTITTMTRQVQDAETHLKVGDVAAARSDGQAVEESWQGVERAVAQRAPREEVQVDQALDSANDALASDPPAADAGARLERLHAALAALTGSLESGATAPVAASDQISVGDGIRLLQETSAALRRGDAANARQVFESFQASWPMLEARVSVESPAIYRQLEDQMTRVSAALEESPPDVTTARPVVEQMTTELQTMVGREEHYGPLDSAITLLREGIEALLVLGALLALVTRAGRPDLRWQVWTGAAAGVVASLLVAVLLQFAFSHFTFGLNRELLEGITGIGAAAMLLYVSYWLHQQASLADWRKFLANRTGQAVVSGNALLLPSLAFLAVFREGAETILLYVGMAAAISLRDLVTGMVLGLIGLVALGIALFGFGLRLSLRPFFRVISVLLYYLAFKFVGTGVHALQVAGVLPTTSADYLPSLDAIGLFPTWQTTAAQALLVGLAIGLILWVAAGQRVRRLAARE